MVNASGGTHWGRQELATREASWGMWGPGCTHKPMRDTRSPEGKELAINSYANEDLLSAVNHVWLPLAVHSAQFIPDMLGPLGSRKLP